MRNAVVAALLSSTAILSAVAAAQQSQSDPSSQPQSQVEAGTECDRLAGLMEQGRTAGTGPTADQIREWRQSNNVQACRDVLQRVAQQPNATSSPDQNQRASGEPADATPPIQQAQSAGPSPSQNAPQPDSSRIVVQQPAPAVRVEQAAPQVVVQQQRPNVTVRQPQPEIIVRQPPPTITVQQPQPEIIVRMPDPDVNVSVAQPQVSVNMPQPQVQVVQPQQQPQVQIQPAQPNVQVQASGQSPQPDVQVERQQPNVRFERTGEPNIIYQQAEGSPQIRYEQAGRTSPDQSPQQREPGGAVNQQADASSPENRSTDRQSAQAQLNSAGQPGYGVAPGEQPQQGSAASGQGAVAPPTVEPETTGAVPPPTQTVQVSRIEDLALYNARNEKMGDVDAVVQGPDSKHYLVVSHGGFLGLGERRVALLLDQVALRGDRLIADELTDEQVKALPEYQQTRDLQELGGDAPVPLRVAE